MARKGKPPQPMIPADCDLADLPSAMIARSITTSDFAALSTGDEFKAGVMLYVRCYEQKPAGSLPNDDRILAYLSGAQRDWADVRGVALRGWVLCGDGRLYHPVTAERVLIAWIGRLTQRLSSGEGNKTRWGREFDRAPIDAQIAAAAEALERLAPGSPAAAKARRTTGKKNPGGTAGGTPGGKPGGVPPRSQAEGEGEAVEQSPSHKGADVIDLEGRRA